MITSIVLSEPTLGLVSQIWPRAGVAYQGHQFTPSVRAVTESKQGGDGAWDSTSSLDEGAFSLNLQLFSGVSALLDEIGAFTHPALRPVITFTRDDQAGPRMLVLRYDTGAPPVELGMGLRRNWQIQWAVPPGKWQAVTPVTATVLAFIASDTGLTFDTAGLSFGPAGAVFPATSSAPETIVSNPGGIATSWTGKLYGPATGPKIAFDLADGTSEQLEWPDSTVLNPGDYIDVDTGARTALLNSDRGNPVDGDLIFGSLAWPVMRKGVNQIRYYPRSAAPGAQAQLSFLPAWLHG